MRAHGSGGRRKPTGSPTAVPAGRGDTTCVLPKSRTRGVATARNRGASYGRRSGGGGGWGADGKIAATPPLPSHRSASGRPVRNAPSLHCIVAPAGGAEGATRTAADARAAIAAGLSAGGSVRTSGLTAGAVTAAGRTESGGSALTGGIAITAAGVGVRRSAVTLGDGATADGGLADGGTRSVCSAARFGAGGGACCAHTAGAAIATSARTAAHVLVKRVSPVLMVSPSLAQRRSCSWWPKPSRSQPPP